MSAPAGWYPTPDGRLRYWDGSRWTHQVAPSPTPQPSADSVAAPPAPETAGSAVGPVARRAAGTWIGWGALCLVALLGAASGGVSGLLVLSGLFVFVVAVIALIRGRV